MNTKGNLANAKTTKALSCFVHRDEIEQSIVVLRAVSSTLCISLESIDRNSEEFWSIQGLVLLSDNEVNRLAKLL